MRLGHYLMQVAAVILSAGASARLGEPKQLAMLGGETLLARALRTAKDAGCSPIVVVLGASVDLIRAGSELSEAIVVVNDNWGEGMGSSIGVGIRALSHVDGSIVMTCDMPGVTAAHLRRLMENLRQARASFYGNRRGVPAYFPAQDFAGISELRGDSGARDLLRSAEYVELPDGEMDVDTMEDLVRARESIE
jgi:molybdenum cofactor cytidylyltransferase